MIEGSEFPKPVPILGIILLSMFVVVLISSVLAMIFIPDLQDQAASPLATKVFITFGEWGLILLPMAYVRARKISFKEAFRLNAIPLPLIGWSILIGLGIAILGDELDRLVSLIVPAPDFLQDLANAMKIHNLKDLLTLSFGAIFAAAFVEESIFRGLLQQSIERHNNVTMAVIYSSLAWTIIHGILFWYIQIFLLGIILGLIAWRSNSIVPSLIAHAINNALALLLYNVDNQSLNDLYLLNGHVSPLFLIPAMAGLVFGVKAFYNYYRHKIDLTIE